MKTTPRPPVPHLRVRDLPHDVRSRLSMSFRETIKGGLVDNVAFKARIEQIADEFKLTDLAGGERYFDIYDAPGPMLRAIQNIFAEGSAGFQLGNDVGERRGAHLPPAGWTNAKVDALIAQAERWGPFSAHFEIGIPGRVVVEDLVAQKRSFAVVDLDREDPSLQARTQFTTLDELSWYLDRKVAQNNHERSAHRTFG